MPETTCVDCEQTVCICVLCTSCNKTDIPDNICSNCGHCATNSCCNCWYCTGCQTIQDDDTPMNDCCNMCESCCSCVLCDNCSSRFSESNFCPECDYCNGCCTCDEGVGYGVTFKNRPLVFHNAKKNEFTKNGSKRHVSIEIEVDRVTKGHGEVTETLDKWSSSTVPDGSLNENGFEINTSPSNGDLFINQINEICSALALQGAKVSSACGLHVHVDARDFTFYDLKKLVFLYEKIEEGLFSVVPLSRRSSRYCTPCGQKYIKDMENNTVPKDGKYIEKKLLENIYDYKNVNVNQVRGNKYHESRYNALNLHSYIYRGTVECRIHSGTVSAEKILNWGMLWAAILDYAMHHNEKEIRALRGDSFEVLLSVAPTKEIKAWLISRRKRFDSGYGNNNDDE